MQYSTRTKGRTARWFSVVGLCTTVVGFALTGCTGSGGSTSSSNTLSVQVQTGTTAQKQMASFIKVFKQKNPGVTIKTTSVSSTAKNGTNLQVITSSNPPDVAILPTNSQAYTEATSGHQVLPLNDVWAKANLDKRYGSALADPLKLDGTPYVVSYDATYYDIVYYNTKLFQKAGITPPSNHRFGSLNELKSAVDKLKAIGVQGLSTGPADKYQSSWMIDAYLQTTTTPAQYTNYISSWQKGKQITSKFTDPPFTRAVAQIQEMAREGIFENGYLGRTVAQSEATFVQQRAGMLLDGNYTVATLKSDEVKFPYDWAMLPPVESGRQTNMTTYNGDAYAIPAKSDNQALAKKFLESMMSTKAQATLLALGSIPAVNDVPKSSYKKLPAQVRSQLADVAHNGSAPGWTGFAPGGIGQQLVDPLVVEMLNGSGSPQTIGQAVQAALEQYKHSK